MKLWIFLCILSICRAEFSIQGPSDGHRQAAGLKFSQDKGVEFVPHKDSIQAGGFSIQGASDGNSNFQIQGATDGNSNFQIQGATDGNANFHIQGATDGNANFHIQGPSTGGSNSYIQGAYDANQPNVQPVVNTGNGRALQYKDPSGLRVNWRSYAHEQRPQYQQPAQQYAEPVQHVAQPRRQPVHRRPQPQPQPQPQPHSEAPVKPPSYTPYNNAPDRIKQLLLFQQQIPYINSIPEQFRYDGLANAMAQAEQFRQEYPKQVLQQRENLAREYQQQPEAPRYRTKQRPASRSKRQAPQQQQHGQPQYRRIPQPPPENLPQYSTNVPASIQQILKYQASIPYDIIANRITYKLDKPYVPQPVQAQPAPAPAPAAPADLRAQYQSQLLAYGQNQKQQQYANPRQAQNYPSQSQYYNPGYGQNQAGIRPVNERQH